MKKSFLILVALAASGCGKVYSPMSVTVTPTYLQQNPGLIDDFESGDSINDFGGKNVVYTDSLANDPPFGGASTMTVLDAPGNTLAGGTPGHAMELTGIMRGNVSWPGPGIQGGYPYCLVEFLLSDDGTNIARFAPKGQIVFAFKASVGDVGQVHRVVIINSPVTNYNWYVGAFTPHTTAWQWWSVDFPPQSALPTVPVPGNLLQTYFGPGAPQQTWAATESTVTGIEFMPFSAGSMASFPYDFFVDDVRFQ